MKNTIKILLASLVLVSCYTPKRIARNVDSEESAKEVVFLLTQKFPDIRTLSTQTIVLPSQTYLLKPKVEFTTDNREIDSLLSWVHELQEDSTSLHNSLIKAREVINQSCRESVLEALKNASADSLSFSPEFINDSLVLNVKFISREVIKEVPLEQIANAEPQVFYKNIWFVLFVIVACLLLFVVYVFALAKKS